MILYDTNIKTGIHNLPTTYKQILLLTFANPKETPRYKFTTQVNSPYFLLSLLHKLMTNIFLLELIIQFASLFKMIRDLYYLYMGFSF